MKSSLDNRALSIHRLGAEESFFTDLYHRWLRMTWPRFLGVMLLIYLALNLVFAFGYWALPDAIANIGPGGYFSYISFSVQTMSTVGYGYLYPQTLGANILVIVQTVVSLFFTAGLTGMVFAKFSAPRARIVFSEKILWTEQNGKPVLCLRLGNFRNNRVFEGRARLTLLRDEISLEGEHMRRLVDLKLQRDRTPVFALSWTLFHPIDLDSPFCECSPEVLRERGWQIYVTFMGMDEDIKTQIIAHNIYAPEHIVRARKFADMIQVEGRQSTIDFSKLNEVEYDQPVAGGLAPG